MKLQNRLALSLAGVLLTAVTSWAGISTDYDHGVNFAQYKTYSWGKIQAADGLWDSHVKDLLFVPFSLAQQQDSATPERANGAPLSRNFAAPGLRASELLRDWQQHIAFSFQNGYPLSEVSIFFDRDRAADALGLAALAASNDADRAALQQLRNLFTSLEQWSDGLVEDKRNLRLARYYMSPTALKDDPAFQRNTECATSIAVMLSSKQLVEISSCQ